MRVLRRCRGRSSGGGCCRCRAGAAPGGGAPTTVRDAEYWLADYGILDAWNVTRGSGVTIAVIDTGVDGSVPELDGAVVGGADFSGARRRPTARRRSGRSTATTAPWSPRSRPAAAPGRAPA